MILYLSNLITRRNEKKFEKITIVIEPSEATFSKCLAFFDRFWRLQVHNR